jgi:PAS domain S-box-containing protein
MDDRLFGSLLKRAFFVPILTLVCIAGILGFVIARLQASAAAVDHTDQVIAQATLLNRLIVDQETGIRGYAAYGDRAFLEPFDRAKQQIDTEFTKLQQLVSDDPSQIGRLTRIRTSYSAWVLSAELELRNVHDPANAMQRKQRMDGIRTQIDEFVGTETTLRAARQSAFAHNNDALYGIGLVVLLLGAGLIGFYGDRSLRELLAAYRGQLALVEQRSIAATGSEAWLRTTLRSIGDAVIACDSSGQIVFMNMVAERLTGWLSGEAKGRALHEIFRIVNETSRAVVESPVDKVRRLGIVVGLANHTILIRRDGTEMHIDDSGAPIINDGGAVVGIVLIFRDITERRQAEAALARADKLASVGRLSAAMAHEVNNPLEALTNLIYLAKLEVQEPGVRQNLELAELELGRIAHIARQSLGFYRDSSSLAMFSVASVVNQTVTFYLARASVRGVALKTDLHSDVELLGSAGELRQVMSNLVSNALDACESGASIRVSLRKHRDRRTGDIGARIVIADSGCGIADHKLAAIFEPFYTTKGSTGTGLGLWVTRQLIEKHGGSIRVRSSSNGHRKGTIFRIFLPAVHAEISAASAMTGEGLISGNP